ncbi:MAG TPA: glycosyltransferase [Usitatibacter sp.]|nr:glycosyltransferase [Usitatibacter sp.]
MAAGTSGPVASTAVALRAAAESLRAGRSDEALRAAQEVLQAVPHEPAALRLAGVALMRLGRVGEAVEALRGAVRLVHAAALANPMDYDASQRVVTWVAEQVPAIPPPPAGVTAPSRDPASPWRRVTVGFCSIDPAREERARRGIAAALSPAPCEFEVIHDPPSLAEGFNRIVERASGDLLILCHDDIEVLSPRLDLALQRALLSAEVVGVAGSQRVAGPAVLWAGHPHIHGWVTYPRGTELEVAPLSLRSGVIPGMQSLDGVFMAMRPETARAIRFDAGAFDGFHFYDLDFSYRAHLAGLRLAVSTDILLAHASEGSFDESWRKYAERFRAKYPSLSQPKGDPHWYGARVASVSNAIAFYDELRALHGSAAANGNAP